MPLAASVTSLRAGDDDAADEGELAIVVSGTRLGGVDFIGGSIAADLGDDDDDLGDVLKVTGLIRRTGGVVAWVTGGRCRLPFGVAGYYSFNEFKQLLIMLGLCNCENNTIFVPH